jgi:hypothetical protein
MVILQRDGEVFDLRISRDELWMLLGALNEVCNGVSELADESEFQTRLGFERSTVSRLLEEIHLINRSSN